MRTRAASTNTAGCSRRSGSTGSRSTTSTPTRCVLSPEFIPQVARVADVLRPWGVRLALAIDFGSPQSLGKLATYDPLDPAVIAWWKARADDLYRAIPDFGGFVLKADSEGRVGPSAYGRTHADAANVVARALAPHGGVILLSRLRLRPSHGLEQSEERSRARRVRQFPTARRAVRRQRDRADQARADRFPGP